MLHDISGPQFPPQGREGRKSIFCGPARMLLSFHARGLWGSLLSFVHMADLSSVWKKKRSQKQFKLGTRHNKEFINKWTLVNFHPDGHSTWVELHEWHGTSFPWFHFQCRAMRRTTWQQALATVQFLKDDHPWPLQSQRLQACLCKNVLLKHPHTLLYVSGYFHTPGRSWVAATKSVGFTRLKLNFLFSGSFLLTLFMNLGPKVGFCFLVPRCWCITSVDLTQGRPFPPLISVFHP